MAFKVADRVKESCTAPGTGTVTLLGAVTEYQSFSSAIGANNTTLYVIADQSGANWEVGVGTVGATGTTLARTTVISSSNGGSLVNFSSGSQYVFCDLPAEKALLLDDNGKLQAGLNDYLDWASVQPAVAAGRMWYDGTTGSWNLGMGGGNITQQVGEELFVYGKASAAITDSPLQIVYQTGTVGASGVVQFAPTVSGITNGDLILGVSTETIALNGFGRITCFGTVHGIATNGTAYGETWADGDVIWYNPTTGNPTKTKPSAPNIKVQIGVVISAGPAGSGSFQVEINHGSVLGGTDANVQFGTLATNNLIQYNGTYWTNVTPGSVTGVGSVANSISAGTGLSGTAFNGSAAQTWTLATAYGDSINPYASKTANYVLAAPNGSAGVPTFRAIVAADIPALSYVSSVTGTSPVASSGGLNPAISLSNGYGDTQNPYGSKTANYVLAAPNGSAGVPTFRAIVAADIPTLNQNTTGQAGSVANSHSAGSGLSGTAFNGSAAVTWTLATAYGDTINPYASKTANYFLAAPNGVAGAPTFRAIVAADIPTLNQNTTGSAGSVVNSLSAGSGLSGTAFNGSAAQTWTLATAYGDTINPYASKTANYFLAAPNGVAGAPTFRAIVAADIPTLNQNTTGTASNVTGVVGYANGGTGLSAVPTNGQLNIGNGSGFTRATITAGLGLTVTNGAGSITIGITQYTASFLVVSGGGCGGGQNGNGGGGGGFVTGTYTVTGGYNYNVVVGAGGTGGGSGGTSSIFTTSSAGGSVGTSGSPQYNGPGSGVSSGYYPAGGGGGAGAVGGNAPDPYNGGAGGVGLVSTLISTTIATAASVGQVVSSSVYFAGGGGGGVNPGTGGSGAYGGGGNGGTPSNGQITAGKANSGGGGGGGINSYTGTGGSGVVIVSIPTANYSGVTTGSPYVTTYSSNTILIFKSSGSFIG